MQAVPENLESGADSAEKEEDEEVEAEKEPDAAETKKKKHGEHVHLHKQNPSKAQSRTCWEILMHWKLMVMLSTDIYNYDYQQIQLYEPMY